MQIEQDSIAAVPDDVTYTRAYVFECRVVYLAAGLGVGGYRHDTVSATCARDSEHSGKCEIGRAINPDRLLARRR